MSLRAALEQLGFDPCLHMIDLIREPRRIDLWTDAAEGRPVDWHALFAGYDATVDWPGCTFYAQLADAFPDAKVLLTVRDPDAWYESTLRTIYAAQDAARSGRLSGDAPSAGLMRVIGALIWEGTFDGRFADRAHAIEVFNRHNEAVVATVPRDRLLVHEIGEGWDPLARFLGADAPDAPFPRLNDTAAFREMVGMPAA